jgi:hypothetical protein
MISTNGKYFVYLKGALVFSYFILRGIQLDEILGGYTGEVDFSIGTYLLAAGLVLFGTLALLQKNVTLPFQLFYLFGVIFLTTFSFLFWDNLNTGSGHLSLYIEYMSSLSLIFFIYFTFQTEREIEIFFKVLMYACLIISLFWITKVILNPSEAWKTGNIFGSGASYGATSYQIVGAIWAGPLVNILDSGRSFSTKALKDVPLLIIFVFGNIFLGSKGGTLALLVIFGFFWYLFFKGLKKKSALNFFTISSPLILAFVGSVVYFASTLEVDIASVDRTLRLFGVGGTGGRIDIWIYSLGLSLADIPGLLIGKGFGNFFLFEAGGWPHNFLVDLAFNAGFPAALLLLFWIVKNWHLNYKFMKQDGQNLASKKIMLQVIGWGIVGWFYAFGDGKFSSATMLWFFLALSIRLRQINISETRTSNQGSEKY